MTHIVLVEDDEPIRFIFQIALRPGDYDLIHLLNFEEILKEEIDVPDLFILDKQIPGADGLEVCRFIKSSQKFRNVPVIIISAAMDIVQLAKEAGADEAIAKPFSLRTLRETIAKYNVSTVSTDHVNV